ncbi:MAG: DNA repair protein RecO [Gammaproteobacteria bacterium]|nr:DNA repair protein RecO [Gammaproteobacteria bacterium]
MAAFERVTLEPAWVLHGRAWRESSEVLDVFTRNHGLQSVVARGMRRPGSRLRALLQPFSPVLLTWGGRGSSLSTLHAAEAAGVPPALRGAALMSGFYASELLLRFLHRGDSHADLFDAYGFLLAQLAAGTNESALRRFEVDLLAGTGYGLLLDREAVTGEPLDPARNYRYLPEAGPVAAREALAADDGYSGADLLAMWRGDWTEASTLVTARRLLRAVLAHHLGERPLRTRAVFSALRGLPARH